MQARSSSHSNRWQDRAHAPRRSSPTSLPGPAPSVRGRAAGDDDRDLDRCGARARAPGARGDPRRALVTWQDPVATAATGAGMSGLEYMRARSPPASCRRRRSRSLLRMQPVELEPGRAVFEGEPGEEHYNPIGVVHGGYAATLLDSALGCAVHTTLRRASPTRR